MTYDPLSNRALSPLGQIGTNTSSTAEQQPPLLDLLARSGPGDSLQGIWGSAQEGNFPRYFRIAFAECEGIWSSISECQSPLVQLFQKSDNDSALRVSLSGIMQSH